MIGTTPSQEAEHLDGLTKWTEGKDFSYRLAAEWAIIPEIIAEPAAEPAALGLSWNVGGAPSLDSS